MAIIKDVEINGKKFELEKMNAMEQVPVIAKVLPILHKIGLIITEGKEVKVKEQATLGDMLHSPFVTKLVEELQTLDEETLQYLMKKFLGKTVIKGAATVPVLDKKGNIIDDDVDIEVVFILIKEHIVLNFEKYLKFVQ